MARTTQEYIELDDDWALTSDSRQWKLCSISGSGEDKNYSPVRYYPTLTLLFKDLYQIKVRSSSYTCLEDIVKNQRAALLSIAKMVSMAVPTVEEKRQVLSEVAEIAL